MREVRTQNIGKTLGLVATAFVIFTATSCKKKTPPPPPQQAGSAPADPGALSQLSNATKAAPAKRKIANGNNVSLDGGGDSFAHVTYNSNVKTFEEADVRSTLQGISSDGHGWIFKNAPASIKALKAGDVFVVKNQLAVKVIGVVTQGDQTLVATGEASLKDMVQSGEINIHAPVHFHGPKTATSSAPHQPSFFDRIVPAVYAAQSGLPGSSADAARAAGTADAARQAASNAGSYFLSGWTVSKWDVVPGDGQANFDLVMAKSQGGFVAMVAMKGWIGDFDLTSNLQFNASAPKQLFQAVKNTKGFIQFDWEIGMSSPSVWATQDRVKLPAGMSIPLAPLLGGMPLTLDISSALQIHPALTGANEYARGGFSINWGGGGGFQTSSGGSVQDGSTLAGTYNVTSDTSISPASPTAMVISYCAPRIELRLDVLGNLSDEVSDFASNIDTIASTLESLLPQSAQDMIKNSIMAKMTASNVLSSNADVYMQFIFTEGSTHSANVSMVPCSKKEMKFDVDAGTAAQFFGLTNGASSSVSLYTHTFTRAVPDSPFCNSV